MCISGSTGFTTCNRSHVNITTNGHGFMCVSTDSKINTNVIVGNRVVRNIANLTNRVNRVRISPLNTVYSYNGHNYLSAIITRGELIRLLDIARNGVALSSLISFTGRNSPNYHHVVTSTTIHVNRITTSLYVDISPRIVILNNGLTVANSMFARPFGRTLRHVLFPSTITPVSMLISSRPSSGYTLNNTLYTVRFSIHGSIDR